MSYTIPAMNAESEFKNLEFLGKYADQLVTTTGDEDYGIAYDWGPHGPGPFPPLAVLYRVDGAWVRRDVLVTVVRKKNGCCAFSWTVNAH